MKLLNFNQSAKSMLNEEVRSNVSGSFIELPDGVVHYELLGARSNHLVVLIHGFSAPYFIWDKTTEPLAQSGFQVLRYDLYGRGYSDRPKVMYDLSLFEKQLLGLLKALQVSEQVDLVGLSMGADIAVHFANQYPHLVRKICLIDPVCFFANKTNVGRLLNLPVVGEAFLPIFVRFILLSSLYDDFYRPEKFPSYKDNFIAQMQYKGFERAILLTYRSLSSINFLDVYSQFAAQNKPVLLLWGMEDLTVPIKMSEKILEVIPQIEFHIIAETRHIPHYERPDLVNPILIQFLKQ